MSGFIILIIVLPVAFVFAVISLARSARRDDRHGDGGYTGPIDGGAENADHFDSGGDGSDGGGE